MAQAGEIKPQHGDPFGGECAGDARRREDIFGTCEAVSEDGECPRLHRGHIKPRRQGDTLRSFEFNLFDRHCSQSTISAQALQ
jgi:hypothetical protein